MIERVEKIILLFLILLSVSRGEDLIANLNYQNNDGSVSPIQLTYNWQNGSIEDQRSLKIKINLKFLTGNSSVILNQPASVKIICSQNSSNVDLYADLNFTEFSDSNLNSSKEIQIDFKINEGGQSPLVRCIGQTVSFSPQTVSGVQLTGLKFANFIDFRIQIRPYPGISFTNTLQSSVDLEFYPFTSSKLNIYFRDVTVYETELNCSLNPISQYFNLSSNVFNVQIGQNKFQIGYDINFDDSLRNITFNLTCYANSIPMLNKQYDPAYSLAYASIRIKQPVIYVSSDLIKFTGTKFSLPLILEPLQPNRDSNIKCSIKSFTSYADLENCVPTTPIAGIVEPDLSSFSYDKTNFSFCFIDPTNSSQCNSTAIFNLKNSDYVSINVEQRPPVALSSSLKLFLCMFCQDNSNVGIKYENYAGKIFLNLARNSDPNAELPAAPTNEDLLNPAYDPCTCDTTLNICDADCCCDNSCSAEDKAANNLICPNQVRPVFDKTIDKWFCQDTFGNPREIEEDWFPIICINFNTTVLLGEYYSPETLDDYVKNQNEKFLNDVQNKVKQSYNYRSRFLNDPATNNLLPVTKSTFCSLEKQSYEYGSCLLQTETQSDTEANDFFRFPQATNSFQSCVFDSPLRFLINSNRTFCPLTLDLNSCSTSNEKINSNFFINKYIIANSNKDKIELNQIEYYFCPAIFASQLPLPNLNSMGPCLVILDPDTKIFDSQLNCESQWTEPTTSNLDQITEDYYLKANSDCKLTKDVDLTLDQNLCKNVLGSVKHLIFWQGNAIKKILTRIILTNVELGDANFKQFFETKWVYLPNAVQDLFDLNSIDTVSDYDNLISGADYLKVMRSGLRGYVNGKPIISGFLKNSQIDAGLDKRFSAFRSLNGKLCGQYNQQERLLVGFGKNMSSSCVVQVAKDDLIDETKCSSIRRIMFHKLNDYFVPANRVSKNGNVNLDLYNETEWLEVFRSQFNESMNSGKNSDEINRCKNVPYKVNLYLFYGNVGRLDGQVINEIFGAYAKVDYRDWVFICSSNDDCSNRPQDFTVEFEANFINDFKKNLTWVQRCQMDKYPSQICIEEALWTWPRDYNDPQFFYLYSVHLGLLFGILSILVFHFMIFGLVCPC